MTKTLKGLVYVKHGQVGTKSEGPEYFLQTRDGDYQLTKMAHPWEPDYYLEFFQRRMVEVDGDVDEPSRTIRYRHLAEILSPQLPREHE
jgi:hypothetical protein